MRCPNLTDLPEPPPDRSGWPWTVESPRLPDVMPDGNPWPQITIVTPSFNQGRFIEETIRSVLLQGYPDLEYIVVDGGSKDETLAVINRYAPWMSWWVSEPDKGQSHALNKGFARAHGEIFAYINSDDYYEPSAFANVATCFAEHPHIRLLAGECVIFQDRQIKRVFSPGWPSELSWFVKKTYSSTFGQPAAFWHRSLHSSLGGFDETLHYCFDREFFLHAGLAGVTPHLLHTKLAWFREHPDSKSMRHMIRFHEESLIMLRRYARACGVSPEQQRLIETQILDEIEYLDVFRKWKIHGRNRAMKRFVGMIRRNPRLLFQRRILGQARRLFTYRTRDVVELTPF